MSIGSIIGQAASGAIARAREGVEKSDQNIRKLCKSIASLGFQAFKMSPLSRFAKVDEALRSDNTGDKKGAGLLKYEPGAADRQRKGEGLYSQRIESVLRSRNEPPLNNGLVFYQSMRKETVKQPTTIWDALKAARMLPDSTVEPPLKIASKPKPPLKIASKPKPPLKIASQEAPPVPPKDKKVQSAVKRNAPDILRGLVY